MAPPLDAPAAPAELKKVEQPGSRSHPDLAEARMGGSRPNTSARAESRAVDPLSQIGESDRATCIDAVVSKYPDLVYKNFVAHFPAGESYEKGHAATDKRDQQIRSLFKDARDGDRNSQIFLLAAITQGGEGVGGEALKVGDKDYGKAWYNWYGHAWFQDAAEGTYVSTPRVFALAAAKALATAAVNPATPESRQQLAQIIPLAITAQVTPEERIDLLNGLKALSTKSADGPALISPQNESAILIAAIQADLVKKPEYDQFQRLAMERLMELRPPGMQNQIMACFRQVAEQGRPQAKADAENYIAARPLQTVDANEALARLLPKDGASGPDPRRVGVRQASRSAAATGAEVPAQSSNQFTPGPEAMTVPPPPAPGDVRGADAVTADTPNSSSPDIPALAPGDVRPGAAMADTVSQAPPPAPPEIFPPGNSGGPAKTGEQAPAAPKEIAGPTSLPPDLVPPQTGIAGQDRLPGGPISAERQQVNTEAVLASNVILDEKQQIKGIRYPNGSSCEIGRAPDGSVNSVSINAAAGVHKFIREGEQWFSVTRGKKPLHGDMQVLNNGDLVGPIGDGTRTLIWHPNGDTQILQKLATGAALVSDSEGQAALVARPDGSNVARAVKDGRPALVESADGQSRVWSLREGSPGNGDDVWSSDAVPGVLRKSMQLESNGNVSFIGAEGEKHIIRSNGVELVEGKGRSTFAFDAQGRIQAVAFPDGNNVFSFDYKGNSEKIEAVYTHYNQTNITKRETPDQTWGDPLISPDGVYSQTVTQNLGNQIFKGLQVFRPDGDFSFSTLQADGRVHITDAYHRQLYAVRSARAGEFVPASDSEIGVTDVSRLQAIRDKQIQQQNLDREDRQEQAAAKQFREQEQFQDSLGRQAPPYGSARRQAYPPYQQYRQNGYLPQPSYDEYGQPNGYAPQQPYDQTVQQNPYSLQQPYEQCGGQNVYGPQQTYPAYYPPPQYIQQYGNRGSRRNGGLQNAIGSSVVNALGIGNGNGMYAPGYGPGYAPAYAPGGSTCGAGYGAGFGGYGNGNNIIQQGLQLLRRL